MKGEPRKSQRFGGVSHPFFGALYVDSVDDFSFDLCRELAVELEIPSYLPSDRSVRVQRYFARADVAQGSLLFSYTEHEALAIDGVPVLGEKVSHVTLLGGKPRAGVAMTPAVRIPASQATDGREFVDAEVPEAQPLQLRFASALARRLGSVIIYDNDWVVYTLAEVEGALATGRRLDDTWSRRTAVARAVEREYPLYRQIPPKVAASLGLGLGAFLPSLLGQRKKRDE